MSKFGYFTGKYKSLDKIRDEERWSFLKGTFLEGILTTTIWEFTNDPERPLTYHMPNGIEIQPDRHYETDLGSVPAVLQPLMANSRFLRSFLLHDSGYEYKGLWCRDRAEAALEEADPKFEWMPFVPVVDSFTYITFSRYQIDRLLYYMIGAEGGNGAQRYTAFHAVNAVGWVKW